MTNSAALPTIDYQFQNPALLEQALTHSSASPEHNERLEFLGDAVLELVVSDLLFHTFPRLKEGPLTIHRASLVNGSSLARIARQLGIDEHLRVAPNNNALNQQESVLSGALEALVGAVFVDGGFAEASEFISKLFSQRLAELPATPVKNPKTELQEILQSRGLPPPGYEITAAPREHGGDYQVVCRIEALSKTWTGQGKQRKHAETAAASSALRELGGR